MTAGVSLERLFCSLGVQTWGSEPCHNPAEGDFGPPGLLKKGFLPKIGERGVVGVVGVVGVLGASSDVSDSGGGDGLWSNCRIINLGTSSSASRSSTSTRMKCEVLIGDREWSVCVPVEGNP